MLNRAKGAKATPKEDQAEFVCPDCGKEYKRKGHFEKHLTKHD
mgnify:FL=1